MHKKLFLASASVLMLAIAYHLGANTATAQSSSNPVVASLPYNPYQAGIYTVVTANGDTYNSPNGFAWIRVGNIFSGPTPAPTQSWGALKAKALSH